MAIAKKYGVCQFCDEKIALRTYANGSWSNDHSVDIWTSGNGRFPADQRVCEQNTMTTVGNGDHIPRAD